MNTFLERLIDRMAQVFYQPKPTKLWWLPVLPSVQQFFIQFDIDTNGITNSCFQKSVQLMSETLVVQCQTVTFIFLGNHLRQQSNIIYAVIHATFVFCQMFAINRQQCFIYVCLNKQTRHLTSLLATADDLKKASAAFTVSGLTNRNDRYIVLTKVDELIKLLFHELIHYSGLDQLLLQTSLCYSWAIDKPLNVSEAFTELMSIVLHSAYVSLHSASLNRKRYLTIFNQLLTNEYHYSFRLSANVLQFYGYRANNLNYFFNNTGYRASCSIAIWEYVILRTILFGRLNSLMNSLTDKLIISADSLMILTDCNLDRRFMDYLKKCMENKQTKSMNYLCTRFHPNTILKYLT